MKKIIFFMSALFLFNSCSDEETVNRAAISFNFTHNWDGISVRPSNITTLSYQNAAGQLMTINALRYLISDIKFHKNNGEVTEVSGYHLVDLSSESTLTFSPGTDIDTDTHTAISFTFGFDEEDNISGAYPDLNAASWNWPDMLGGGYHFLQLEGTYLTESTYQPYVYHYGTARVSEGVFEPNHFVAELSGANIIKDATVEIEMNIAEWFKNPHTWDLTEFDTDLMMNYTAQKRMQDNGITVFTLGSVNQ